MPDKPVIFISATSDLRSARDLVGKVLFSMGYEPVWQDIAALEGGELLDVLRRQIAPAALMIQLVGRRYGTEPPRPTAEFGRVSYTQFEALEAERIGKKVVYHFLDDNFPTDAVGPEPAELVSRQADYRQRLVEANRLRYDRIASPQDLELSILHIRDELALLRQQADRRHQNLVGLGIAALVATAGVGILAFAILNHQKDDAATVKTKLDQQATQLQQQVSVLANLRAEVHEAVRAKRLSPGQRQPPPIPKKILDKAQVLVAQGDAEEQALGKIALKQFAEAKRIIQELKRTPGNPIDHAFRICTLEGDIWYQSNEPDKAIEPYDAAMALKPRDFEARQNLVCALSSARLGDVSAKLQRAIKIAEETLLLTPAGSTDWALTQNLLGTTWSDLATGSKAENMKKAIKAYGAALTVYTKEAHPDDWAMMQNNFSTAWLELSTGNKAENVVQAINACEAALTVYTQEKYPDDWAMAQDNLGNAWSELPTGDKGKNMAKAIAGYEAALRVYTKEAYPDDWGRVQNNLGLAWSELPTGDKSQNLKNAIKAYEASLTVRTKEAYPADWAATETNLGKAWWDLPTGDRDENVRKGIAAYEASLTVNTEEADPDEWAATKYNIGMEWSELTTGDRAANLRKAIAAYEAALTAFTKDADATDWADTQNNLGFAWFSLPTGNKAENLRKAIAAYEAALTVYSKASDAADWARVQSNLGTAWSDLPTGSKAENLKNAITAYGAAVTVYTKEANPAEWANTQNNLGFAWYRLPTGNKAENLKKAITAYEAALTVDTKEADRAEWVRTNINLAAAWSELPTGATAENLKKAIAAYKAALSVGPVELTLDVRRQVEDALSFCQLLAKDFVGALATCERAPKEDADYLLLQANHAHALLLLGRTAGARQIYNKYVGQKIPKTGKSWEQTVLDDFDELEKNGIKSPEFAKIRDMLRLPARKVDGKK
jgi:Domain of unknown function (DUF4062)/Tetratricopeptide repeat